MISFLKSKLSSSNNNSSIPKDKDAEDYYQKSMFIQNCSDASNPFNPDQLNNKLLAKQTPHNNKSNKKDNRKNNAKTDDNRALSRSLCCTKSETSSSQNLSSSSLLLLLEDDNHNVKNINCTKCHCKKCDNNQIESFESGWKNNKKKKKSPQVSINSTIISPSSSSSSPFYTSVKMASRPSKPSPSSPQPPSPTQQPSPPPSPPQLSPPYHNTFTRIYAVCSCDNCKHTPQSRQTCAEIEHLSTQHLPSQQLQTTNSINANFNNNANTINGTIGASSAYNCNDIVDNSIKTETGNRLRTRDSVDEDRALKRTNEVTISSRDTACTTITTSNQESTHDNIYDTKTSTSTSTTSRNRCRPQKLPLEGRWRMDGEEGHDWYKEHLRRLNSSRRESYLHAPNITITHREEPIQGLPSIGREYRRDV